MEEGFDTETNNILDLGKNNNNNDINVLNEIEGKLGINFNKIINDGEVDEIDDVLFNIRTEDDYFQKLDFKNVVTYEDSNYISRIKKDKPLLMYIYAPYVPECQQTIETFVSMANFIKNNKTDLTMSL